MNNQLVISVDSSTTACKAIAWDERGNAVAEGRASYPLLQPHPTWYEQDVEEWWSSTVQAISQCVSQIDVKRVVALGITHQRESFALVDAAGKAVRNGILWLDERSRPQVNWLAQTFGANALHQVTGKPLAMTPSLPKIVWLLQNEPEAIAKAHKIVDVHAFLTHRLTGQFRTSLASADPMGLVDMANQRWAVELIEALGLRQEHFSELVAPGEIIGYLSPAAAVATGLPTGLPVVAGGGDGQCAGLGANATGNRAYLNMGTAVVSGAMGTEYVADRAFRTLYAPLAGCYFFEHVLKGGVFTVSWYVEKFATDLRNPLLGRSPEQILEAAAAKVPPGALGLLLVPYWNNVMDPYWDPAASGIMVGWNGAHGREHFYRAILEGVAFEQRLVGDAMMKTLKTEDTPHPITEYVTMGGGSRSALWCQIMADITGVPVVRSSSAEATCLGPAILAAAAVQWYADARCAADAMTSVAERFEPNPEQQALYEPLYQDVYKQIFPTLQPLVDRLTALTHGE